MSPDCCVFQETPLQLASSCGYERVVSILLANGADVTKKNEQGKCCLIVAIEKGHRCVVGFASLAVTDKSTERLLLLLMAVDDVTYMYAAGAWCKRS